VAICCEDYAGTRPQEKKEVKPGAYRIHLLWSPKRRVVGMKTGLLVVAVLVISCSTGLAAPQVGGTEFGGDFWFRYQMDRANETTGRSAFNVERGYLGLGYAWSDDVSGQMTLNVFTSPAGTVPSGWQFELRDAYVNIGSLMPWGKVRVGLQKDYFGTVYDWKYLTVRPSLADAEGVVAERDYGIAFMGPFGQGLGEWTLASMNGEGFDSGLNPPWADRQPDVMANVRFVPVMQTVVGLSFLADKRWVYGWDDVTYETRLAYRDRRAFSALAKVENGPLSLMGEYLYYDYPIPDRDNPTQAVNVTGAGFSIFPVVRLSEKAQLVGRYDSWDPDTDSDKSIWMPSSPDLLASSLESTPTPWWLPAEYEASYYYVKHDVYVVGLNYNITERMKGAPGVIFQFNWQRMDPQEKIGEVELDPIDSFVLQVRWGWGGLNF
jgi:hypothetical protein